MTADHATVADAFHLVEGRPLTRRNVEAAIAHATMPIRLVECDLQGIDLSRLDLSAFSFERCVLIEADLSHVQAASTSWRSCRARSAILVGADLADASFLSGDWSDTEWTSSQISGALFSGTKLAAARFTCARSLGVAFEDCPMQAADLRGISFSKSKLGRCDMSRANLAGCDMREAAFEPGSSLSEANLSDVRLDGADLRAAELVGHGIDALKVLRGARITSAQAAAIVATAGIRVG